ncbi:MAG: nickel-dependent hydrogenase large subunit [Coriobacteriaceae bacterium]|nr:nickel-dependent hydrogenase large subunit [Coriobacteriaceae bacterium]
MATHSIIDPVDRIEGHLRIEMEVTDGYVSNAWVSGGLFRGFEKILEGREPYDAAMASQRVCGVCPVSHCHTSTYAAEAAYDIQHPEGARLVRNIIEGAQFMHSHILWFYQLSALDYVNPLNALNADPQAAVDFAQQNGLAVRDFAAVQERLKTFAANGQYSWLSGGYFMDGQSPDLYKLPPEVDLIAVAHYIEAIDMQAKADEICAIMGGKMPHIMTSIPGGTAFVPSVEKIDDILFRSQELHDWVKEVMIPDAIAIAGVYLDDLTAAGGTGAVYGSNKHGNFMAYGVFDKQSRKLEDRYFPSGIVRIHEGEPTLEKFDGSKMTEVTAHAYYDGDQNPLHPLDGVTVPPETFPGFYKNEATEEVNDKYTWSKAPRYNGEPMEVGPLARVLVSYMSGVQGIKDNVDYVLTSLGLDPASSIPALNSALGRLAARPIEAEVVAGMMADWCTELVELMGKDSDEPLWHVERARDTGTGEGFWEAPRGALYHCEEISGNKIKHYQEIVPSTWNISPRDEKGTLGTIEQGLLGTPIANMESPLEALRLVHGYDPCVACAVHVVEPKTGKEFEVHTSPWGGR